jgi:Na+/phosphate symporter
MKPTTLRLMAIVFIVAGAVLMFLNLKRVADLGTFWVGIPLFVIGLALLARSKRATL